MRKSKSGIYLIENLIDGKKYVGSAIKLGRRKSDHFKTLRWGTHHGAYLQHAYNKYGQDAFRFRVVLFCEKFELQRYEQHFIDTLKPEYNMSKSAVTCLGTKHTEESRQHMREAHAGQRVSPEAREKMSKTRRGMKQTPEWIEKRRLAHIGLHPSEEARRKMSESAKRRCQRANTGD